MYEGGVSIRQGQRDSGTNQGAFAGSKDDIGGCHEIGTGIARVRVRRQRHTWVESQNQHVERVRHGARPYATLAHVNRTPTMIYRERLRVPVSWWFLGLLAVGTVWVTVAAALSFTAAGIVGLFAAALIAAALLAYGGLLIAVTNDEFRAGIARLPLWAVGEVTPLDATTTRALVGPRADPRAFLVLRGYISTAIRVDVADPADPTPYWLVSTRHPARCAEAIKLGKTDPATRS
jgi:hypothetical protein